MVNEIKYTIYILIKGITFGHSLMHGICGVFNNLWFHSHPAGKVVQTWVKFNPELGR